MSCCLMHKQGRCLYFNFLVVSLPIYVTIVAEDELLEVIAKRLLVEFKNKYEINKSFFVHGCGEIDKNIKKWNQAASNNKGAVVYFILRDMDSLAFPHASACPEMFIKEKLGNNLKSPHLLFRMAVAEAENWLFADIDNFCQFIGCVKHNLPSPDKVADGKNHILGMVRLSKKKKIREGLLPSPEAKTAKVGRDWNHLLPEFVRDKWDPNIAAKNSKSLRRTMSRLRIFPNES